MGGGNRCAAGGSAGVRAGVPAGDLSAGAGGSKGEGGAEEDRVGLVIAVSIPLTVPPLNRFLRMHWSKRRKLQKEVSWLLQLGLHGAGFHGIRKHLPLRRCDIDIVRFSRREPDPDGLPATAKPLLDALQPLSKTHPFGLGVIAEDSSECIRRLTVRHSKGANRTEVTIHEVRE